MLKLPGHTRYAYSPIVKRKTYDWPGGKRLAFYVALNIEHFAFGAGLGMDPVQPQRTAEHAKFRLARLRQPDRQLAAVRNAGRAEAAGDHPAQQQRLLPVPGDRGKDQSARRRCARSRPHQCRTAAPDVGAGRGARHRGMHRGHRKACRRAADRMDGAGRDRIQRHARSAEGGGLHPSARLAVRRSADLDADPCGAAPFRALSHGTKRRRCAGASRSYRPRSSPR